MGKKGIKMYSLNIDYVFLYLKYIVMNFLLKKIVYSQINIIQCSIRGKISLTYPQGNSSLVKGKKDSGNKEGLPK